MDKKTFVDDEYTSRDVRDYEKPCLDSFPDYIDTTLQQTIIIPGGNIWNEQ